MASSDTEDENPSATPAATAPEPQEAPAASEEPIEAGAPASQPIGRSQPAQYTPPTIPDRGQRYHDAYAAADAQFQKQWSEGPGRFKSSLETPPTPTNFYRQAEKQSDQDTAQQLEQSKADFADQQKAALAEREAQFRNSGQRFFKDAQGQIQPIMDPASGRPLYNETPWTLDKHPKTGDPVLSKIDRFGQTQYRGIPLEAPADPNDPQLYYKMPDGTTAPAGKIDELLQSPNQNTARLARKAVSARRRAQANEGLQAIKAQTDQANVDAQTASNTLLQAQVQYDQVGQQIAQLQQQQANPDPNGPPDQAERAAAQMAVLQQHQHALSEQVKPGGPLDIAAKQARLTANRASLLHKIQQAKISHDNFVDAGEDRLAVLKSQGKDPDKDPIYQSILAAQDAHKGNIFAKEMLAQRQAQQTQLPSEPAPASNSQPAPQSAAATAPAAPAATPAVNPASVAPQPGSLGHALQSVTSDQPPNDSLKAQWAKAGPLERLAMMFGSKGYGQTQVQGATPIVGSESGGSKGGLFTIPAAKGDSAAAGIKNAAAEFVSSLTTPDNVALMAATDGAGALADIAKGTKLAMAARGAKAAALGGFVAQGAKGAVDSTIEAKRLLADPNASSADRAKAIANAILQTAMAGVAAHGAIGEGKAALREGKPPTTPEAPKAPEAPPRNPNPVLGGLHQHLDQVAQAAEESQAHKDWVNKNLGEQHENQPKEPNATPEGQQPQSRQPEHQGTPSGSPVSENVQQVREGESPVPSRGDSSERSAQEPKQVEQPRPEAGRPDEGTRAVQQATPEGAPSAEQPGENGGRGAGNAERGVLTTDDVAKLDGPGFRDYAKSLPEGFTPEALRLGKEAASDADAVKDLRDRQAEAENQMRQAKTEGRADDMASLASKAQFFSEAAQAAEGEHPRATPVKAEAPKSDFEQFPAEMGGKGIPRAEMPQIKGEHRGALVNFLKAKGITAEETTIKPDDLKPTQAEFSLDKVNKARERGDDRPVLISSDNHVVDGHHQWLAQAAENPDKPIRAIRLDAPAEKVVSAAREFPSSTRAEGATPAEPQAAEAAPTKLSGPDRLIAALRARKMIRPGMVSSPDPLALAHDGAIEVAVKAIQAGQKVAQVVKAAVNHFRQQFPNATKEDVNRLRQNIEDAHAEHEKAGTNEVIEKGVTSTKNAVVDAEREKRGLEPAMKAAAKDFGRVWDSAMRQIDANPDKPEQLVNELLEKPRAVTDEENAMLLHRQITLQNEFDKTNAQINEGHNSGSFQDQAELRERWAALKDKLVDNYDATRAAGTETARGLNARKMLAKEDYSLAKIESNFRAAKGGEPLSATERTQVQELHAKVEAARKALDDYRTAAEDKINKLELDKAVLRMVQDTKAEGSKKASPGKISKFIDDRAAEARQRIKERLSGARVSDVTSLPAHLYDLAIVGAQHLKNGITKAAEWSHEMVKEFGDSVKPHLDQVFNLAKNTHDILEKKAATVRDTAAEKKSTTQKLKENLDKGESLADNESYVHKLALQFVRDGITQRDALVEAVHGELKKADPDITQRQAQDAISGYGKIKSLDPDAAKATLRGLKGELQNVSKLQDMQAGKAPSKTGFERRVPTDEERRLIQQVNEAKRRGGFQVTDPATQLKSSQAAIETRLKNQIADLEHEITTRQRIVKQKTAVPDTKEITDLRAKRDELKRAHEEIFQKPGLTDEQRMQRASQYLDRQIEETQRQLKTGELFAKAKRQPLTSPELEAKRARLDALKEEREYARQTIQPDPERPTPDEVSNRAYKVAIKNRIADLQEKMAKADFTRDTKRDPFVKDPEAQKLQADYNKAKLEVDRKIRERELAQRPFWAKALDNASGTMRLGALSRIGTLGKLAALTPYRMLELPLKEASAHITANLPVLGKAVRSSEFERPTSLGTIAKFYTSFAREGFQEAYRYLKTGDTQGSLEGGKRSVEPPHWYDFFSNLHKLIKTPLLSAAHEFYYRKGMEAAMQDGVNVNDPLVQGGIRARAYQYAQRQILQEKNALANAYTSQMAKFQKLKPDGNPEDAKAFALSHVFESVFTKGIIKTPLNHASQAIEMTPAGGAFGLARAATRFRKGFADMTPEQRNGMARLINTGAIGTAAMLYGMYDATKQPKDRIFGGYFEPGDKRDPADAKFANTRIGGHEFGSWSAANPAVTVAQMGSTLMRVFIEAAAREQKKDPATHLKALRNLVTIAAPMGAGTTATGGALLSEGPIGNTMGNVGKLIDPTQNEKATGELLSSFVPGLLAEIAKWTDPAKNRYPRDAVDSFAANVPGMRETVPDQPKEHLAPHRR